jgi:hypothetical protein
MAGDEDKCWRCGAQWASEEAPQTTVRLIPARAPFQAEDGRDRGAAVAVTAGERTATEVRLDAERWTNEGGSFAAEVAAPIHAAARR